MKTTVFTKYHIAAGARMAEFAGYNMPIEFTGINDEHMAVRGKEFRRCPRLGVKRRE